MFRKLCTLIAMFLAVGGAFWSPPASAQPTCPQIAVEPASADTGDGEATVLSADASDESTDVAPRCAEATAYPGPFTNTPPLPTSPYISPAVTVPVVAPVIQTAPQPASSSDLAHSGSELAVLGYLGSGLVAFGLVALGIRRSHFVE